MHPTFARIQDRCRNGVFDLRWITSPARGTIGLYAEFEESGDYFTIWAKEISYLELASTITIWGGIEIMPLETISKRVPKYSHLAVNYFGTALVLWETQESLETAPPDEIFVVVADEFAFELGTDFLMPDR